MTAVLFSSGFSSAALTLTTPLRADLAGKPRPTAYCNSEEDPREEDAREGSHGVLEKVAAAHVERGEEEEGRPREGEALSQKKKKKKKT